ncbi:MAG: ribonuclease III [Candidatus Kapabacteria bacterium]|nr:ribonuclease III [Candidatus Kapabacteria bacterium]
MIEKIQQIYNGLLRFKPIKKHLKYIADQRGIFPSVGFLTDDIKSDLEKVLGVKIHHREYFEQALIHRSYLQVIPEKECLSNERLEFLGDSVLGMLVAEYLFSLHTHVLEGELTKMRSWLVNTKSLAICSEKLNLQKFIMMSFSARKSLERGSDHILADLLEAIIAAIYIDSGLDAARTFVINSLFPILMNKSTMTDKNYKSILLEKVQALGIDSPKYQVLSEAGPDHEKDFKVGVYVNDILQAEGKGKSKKLAEQEAAENALNNFEFSGLPDNIANNPNDSITNSNDKEI